MKKYDALLKKVELFHRLAMFGDRKAFLQSLAQITNPNQELYQNPDGSWAHREMNMGFAPHETSTTPAARVPQVINGKTVYVDPNTGRLVDSGGRMVDPKTGDPLGLQSDAPGAIPDRDPNLMLQQQFPSTGEGAAAQIGRAHV